MTDILFYGDPHGEFMPLLRAVESHQPAAVVLLGDMEAPKSLDEILAPIGSRNIPIHWIAGNHDTDSPEAYNNLFHSGLAAINLHGRVVDVAGLRVAGLGGVFRERVWRPGGEDASARYHSPEEMVRAVPRTHLWKGGVSLKHRSSIFPSSYQALLGQQAHILVCHEAPECHRHGFKAIGGLAGCLQARQIVHGHHHWDYEDTLRGGIEVRGVGKCGLYRLDVAKFKNRYGL